MPYDEGLNFIFRFPTKVIFGPDSVREAGLELDDLGCKRALLVTDRDLANSEIIAKVKESIGTRLAGVFGEVEPDSGVHIVNRGAELARSLGVDSIVSAGGGSSIDTAKGIQICLKLGGKLEDHAGFNIMNGKGVPHIVIPTTAGTGSEVTYAAVIKDHSQNRKLIFGDNNIIPDIAILDPVLISGLPPKLTAATGMDALCHGVEAVHSLQREPIADGLALHAIRLIYEYLPRSVENGRDIIARGQMLIAATLSGAAFSNAQVGLIHALAHAVGGKFKVPHGVANSILMPHCMRYNLDAVPDRYALIADALRISRQGMSDEEAALKAIERITDLAKRIGLPMRLRDVGVPEERLEECVPDAMSDGSIVYNPKFISDPEDILKILKEAW